MRDAGSDSEEDFVPGALDTETLRAMGLIAGAAPPVAPAYAVEVPAPQPYAPPDEVPALQRLPDNLPPLGADGTAGGAGEKPNAGLLTSAAV